MKISKCDLCKKVIKSEPIVAGIGYFPKTELCEKCGDSIVRFLAKHKFIDEQKLKNIRNISQRKIRR